MRKISPSNRNREIAKSVPGCTHVPDKEEIARAVKEAIDSRVYAKTDEAISRAIVDDPDTFEPDFSKMRVVIPGDLDVARIRSKFGLSQAEFGQRTGVSARVIADWEQGRKKPAAAARGLLIILDELGEKALRALTRRVA